MTVMVSQAAAFGFGEWGARGDRGQMTAEDQLIPSTLPLILGWNIFSRFNCNIYSRFYCNLTDEITAEDPQKNFNTPIGHKY